MLFGWFRYVVEVPCNSLKDQCFYIPGKRENSYLHVLCFPPPPPLMYMYGHALSKLASFLHYVVFSVSVVCCRLCKFSLYFVVNVYYPVHSASETLQCVQGNGNCYIISEHSWQYISTSFWGHRGSRFTSSTSPFFKTGLKSLSFVLVLPPFLMVLVFNSSID